MGPEAATPTRPTGQAGSIVACGSEWWRAEKDGRTFQSSAEPSGSLQVVVRITNEDWRHMATCREYWRCSTARAASSRTARQRGRTLRQYVQGREQQFDQVAKHEVKRVGLMLDGAKLRALPCGALDAKFLADVLRRLDLVGMPVTRRPGL